MTRTVQPEGKYGHTLCPNRHWFAYYGIVGTSSPVCRRCGAPNPNYRPEADPRR